MVKKIFALCLAMILILQCAALAKEKKSEEIPIEERIKISVEVEDKTSFQELDTKKFLRLAIIEELAEKNMFTVLPEESSDEKFSAIKSLGEKQSASDVGEFLVFNPAENNSEFDKNFYANLGADYVIQCKIIGLGTTKKNFDSVGIGSGIGLGRHSHFGIGIFTPIGINFRRTIYCTAVNVKFMKVDTNVVVWQKNIVGQAFKHKKPKKNYDDATDEAYLESIESVAENISDSVEKYAKKFLLKKPDDKSAKEMT